MVVLVAIMVREVMRIPVVVVVGVEEVRVPVVMEVLVVVAEVEQFIPRAAAAAQVALVASVASSYATGQLPPLE